MSITNAIRSSARTARRTLVAGLTGAAGLAILAAPLATADAAPACAPSACITNLAVTPGGVNASIVFDSSKRTTDHFEVSYNNHVVAQADYAKPVTHHQLTTPASLDPNTTYTWLLQTTDTKGHSVSRAGTLTTLHRQVDVQFTTITVTNDSDADSPGEFRTWFRVADQSHIASFVPEDIGSGSTVLAADLIRVRDTGNTTPVYTEMLDNDTFNPFLPSSQWPFPNDATWTSGSSPLWDWATATASLPTRNATPGLVPFQLSVNGPVGFVVHGYYSVTYVS